MWIDCYVGNFLLFVLICEVFFVIFIFVFIYCEFKRFFKMDLKEYMIVFWIWVEIVLLGLLWISIVLYFIRFGLDKFMKKVF